MNNARRLRGAVGAIALLGATIVMSGHAGAGPYVGGATVVVKQGGEKPIVDDGGVICDLHTNTGVGGGCIPFEANIRGILVQDMAKGVVGEPATNVAFQVCIDNDGDSACTTEPDPGQSCADYVVFSHDDQGNFFNPIGPLPQGFTPGCHGSFPGYVVFLCQAVHATDAPHTHPVTSGVIQGTQTGFGGPGFGNFCGGLKEQKPFLVIM